ncbi:hypothetical protein ACWFRN_17635, partial [Streptomyces celluloflavus]
MNDALWSLLELLDLERIEQDIFRGQSRDAIVPRVFGGQVAAQALVAGGRAGPAPPPPPPPPPESEAPPPPP